MIYRSILGEGPDFVLLHGFAFHSGVWESWVNVLKDFFTLHLIDLPGFGQSAAVPMGENLMALLQQLLPILPRSAVYCGWSLGGLIATALSIFYPERVKQLITLSSTPYFLARENWPGVTPLAFSQFYQSIEESHAQGLQKFLLLGLAGQRRFRSELQKLIFYYGEPNLVALLTALNILKQSDLSTEIKRINCRSLHIAGEHDPLTPFNQKFSRTIIKKSGHFLPVTDSDVVLNEIKQFLRSS